MRTELMCVLAIVGVSQIAQAQYNPASSNIPGYGPPQNVPSPYYSQPGYYGPTSYPANFRYLSLTNPQMVSSNYQPSSPSGYPLPAGPGGPMPVQIQQPPMMAQPVFTPPNPTVASFTPSQGSSVPLNESNTHDFGWNPIALQFGNACNSLFCAPPLGPYSNNCDRFWVNADFTLSWFSSARLPGPLVTIGSTADSIPGAVGSPGTSNPIGDSLRFNTLPGVRFQAGVYLDDEARYSIDLGGIYIFPSKVRYSYQSDATGNPVIARPFFDLATGSEQAEINSFPTTYSGPLPDAPATGGTLVETRTELYGFEVNAREKFILCSRLRAEAFGGFRYLRLGESLTIQDQTTFAPPGTNFPVYNNQYNAFGISDVDSFQTSNNFYGLQLGGTMTYDQGWYFLKATGKLAMGANQEKAEINGFTTFNTMSGPVTVPGGILALPSNSGSYRRTVFGVVPELGLTAGANITSWMRITAGYSLLYWNSVARPGNQIDRMVNSTLIPGDYNFAGSGLISTTGPLFHFNNEALWINSVTMGVEFHY